jgi:hypothetical protein
MKKIITLCIICIITLGSCTKFEEGPFITLRTNKQRIAQTWLLEAKYDATSGQEVSFDDNNKMTFSKEGDFTNSVSGIEKKKGTWAFIGDDELQLTNTLVVPIVETYRIIKLYNDEFWIIDDNHEYHYKPY